MPFSTRVGYSLGYLRINNRTKQTSVLFYILKRRQKKCIWTVEKGDRCFVFCLFVCGRYIETGVGSEPKDQMYRITSYHFISYVLGSKFAFVTLPSTFCTVLSFEFDKDEYIYIAEFSAEKVSHRSFQCGNNSELLDQIKQSR